MPATASANTIGIEMRISATKMTATAASIMSGLFRSVQRLVLRRRGDEHREAIEGDQDATDKRGGVEPGEIDLQPGRRQRAVEQAELVAVPRGEAPDADDQRMVEAVDPELRGRR